ncbi:hypothetical protein DMC30DRAFT_153755 [Rhodotorula diobovata]|uniref:F-box domain-containing protein n=1 Tax=Rhodotorula diobovata TaxID=5288 RepID=A0A5C5FLD2_9BASI|nr:hypothetical protein DMC30DRAFT_153755 [Rhodotorula diobovata]
MATPPPPPLSPAARLPTELVEIICDELAVLRTIVAGAGPLRPIVPLKRNDLRACALVFRQWRGPAQTALYRSLYLAERVECDALWRTFCESPHLVKIPRTLVILIGIGEVDDTLWNLGSSLQHQVLPWLLKQCKFFERLSVYFEWSSHSIELVRAITGHAHLREVVFENGPFKSNSWVADVLPQLPSSVRVLGVEDSLAKIESILTLPPSVKHFAFRCDEVYSATDTLARLCGLLEADSRRLHFRRFSLYLDKPHKADEPTVLDLIGRAQAGLAKRGVAFQCYTGGWSKS